MEGRARCQKLQAPDNFPQHNIPFIIYICLSTTKIAILDILFKMVNKMKQLNCLEDNNSVSMNGG